MPGMILPVESKPSGYCGICSNWIKGPSGKMICKLNKIACGKFHSCGDWNWNGKY